jgi:cytoskeletal protein RodZ
MSRSNDSSLLSPVVDRENVCSRCGAKSQGSAWCPKCGLNLRPRTLGAPAASERAASANRPDQPPREDSSRPKYGLIGGGAAALVAVAVVLTIVLSGAAHHAAAHAMTSPTPTPPHTAPTPSPAPSPSSTPSTEEVQQVLTEYESDYSNEDTRGLEGLFAEDFTRQNGTEPREDREQALATYQRQFEGQTNPVYELSETQITPAPNQAEVGSQYTVTNQAATDTGAIGFHMIVQNGHLLIDAIVTQTSR